MTNGQLKQLSKSQLKGKWGVSIAVSFVATIMMVGIELASEIRNAIKLLSINQSNEVEMINALIEINSGSIVMDLLTMILIGLAWVGVHTYYLNIAKNNEAKFTDIFAGFKVFLKVVGLQLIISIVVGIGLLLLIVPGIIAMLAFSQAYCILAEDNGTSIKDCLKESTRMMKGYKFDFFILQLSFIGWLLLCILTLGIGTLWFDPYYQATITNFYLDIKGNKSI